MEPAPKRRRAEVSEGPRTAGRGDLPQRGPHQILPAANARPVQRPGCTTVLFRTELPLEGVGARTDMSWTKTRALLPCRAFPRLSVTAASAWRLLGATLVPLWHQHLCVSHVTTHTGL